MPISRVFIARFFQLVAERRFAEAERMLERSEKRARKNEWNKGYFKALSGILLAQKSNDDRYLFLPNINPADGDKLKSHQRDFLEHTRNMTHADYDRGFFSAWNDFTKILLKLGHDRKQEKMQEIRKDPAIKGASRKTLQTKLV